MVVVGQRGPDPLPRLGRRRGGRASCSSTVSPRAPGPGRRRAAGRLGRATVVAMDLRGHGLSDAPTATGAYALDELSGDVVAVAEGSGALEDGSVVLVGHGFGAEVAAAAAARLGERCAGLVLVDGGLADVAEATGQDVEEFLRALEEPPEVMRSMSAYLRDRRSWDPATWDADQERAARAAVVETPAGRLVSATRPHALEACVRTEFAYRPADVLPQVTPRSSSSGGPRPATRTRQASATPFRPAPTSSTSRRRVTTCCATDRTRSRPRSSAAEASGHARRLQPGPPRPRHRRRRRSSGP